MVNIEQQTYVALGLAQRQHDAILHALYRSRLRHTDLGDIARDPETLYHLETVEAICRYVEDR